jgi:GT2 family glycosyltransferase
MLQLCQREGVGAVGAKLLYENDTIQHVGITFWNGLPDHIRSGYDQNDPGYFFSSCSNRNYLAVTGAAMMTSSETFKQVGGFDERFAVNYNDIDYCLKVHSLGQRVVFAANAILYHFESITRERIVAENEIQLFLDKWGKETMIDPYYGAMFDAHPPNYLLNNE